jgi:hypothetical protein
MAKILRNLRIDDVSSVDSGAGRGVRVVLTKRDAGKHRDGVPGIYNKPISFGADLPDAALAYLKREFTQAERDSAAESGAALPDGSFPIHNKSDLKNAIQAIGRAKDPAKAKAHIKARAKTLGATDVLPESWSKRSGTIGKVLALVADRIAKGAMDFEDAQGVVEASEDAEDLLSCVRQALYAFECSVRSIVQDDDADAGDKAKAIADSYEQFCEYLQNIDPEADDDDDDEMGKIMTTNTTVSPAVQKIIDEAVAKAVGEVKTKADEEIAKLQRENVIAKMSAKHKAFHDGLSDTDKKKFEAMSPDERDGEMDKTKKRYEEDPIYKQMRSDNEALQKRLQAIEDERALDVAKKDAKELGMTASNAGEVLMKARRGDRDAMKAWEDQCKQIAKAAKEMEKTGKVFAEFGTSQGTAAGSDGSAMAELTAKASELRKTKPDLTEAQAFDKVMSDPANRELAARERDERMAKIHRAA